MRLVLATPIGPLGVETRGDTVIGVTFGARPGEPGPGKPRPGEPQPGKPQTGEPAEHPAATELAAYFAGELTDFTVPVTMVRGSEFERAVWTELSRIPYGTMRTYGEIATALGDPGAARAVGTACNRNPVPVIVPCHRVVGAGGKLVGFGGGLDRKRRLLELEARVAFEHSWR